MGIRSTDRRSIDNGTPGARGSTARPAFCVAFDRRASEDVL
jgi:hypothetical protein